MKSHGIELPAPIKTKRRMRSRLLWQLIACFASRWSPGKTAILVLALSAALPSKATGTGEEVVVVYNKRVPESKTIAEYYCLKRSVPSNHLFGFELSNGEEMTRAEFRDELQKPLWQALQDAKLWRIASQIIPATTNQPGQIEWRPVTSKIRYLVLCYGVPLRIAKDPDHKEAGMEAIRPELRRNEAAVDSELALLPALEQHLPLFGPLRNPVYTSTNAASLNPTNNVLMVARLDGPTPELARSLVDRALEGERSGLWGRAYFDIRGTAEPGYKIGDDWLRTASEVCRHLGFETIVDTNAATFGPAFPASHIAFYAGWYDQDVSGPFARPQVEFMPGAFAYHLHSYSAHTLRSTNRFWAGPLIAKGAAATMGCVDEPYLTGTPDIGIFTTRFLYNAFSFGEAAYACQPVLSWQTTIIGDPLYRPFANDPDTLHRRFEAERSPLLQWSYLRLLNMNLANRKPLAEIVGVLETLPVTRKSAVLQEKLGDLYQGQGKPSSSLHAYQQALKLGPSFQQRVRLRLILGEKLEKAEQLPEAYEQYQALLEEYPDYPDKRGLCALMMPLAEKLKKTVDVEKFRQILQSPP